LSCTKKLLIKSQKEDGELVVSQNGKVVRIKARELKKNGAHSE
jgi:hypothetical protein